jgi:general stress protein 26
MHLLRAASGDAGMASIIERIREIVANGTDMTIATIRDDGYPQATTVSYIGDGLDVWFGTDAHTQKARNLAKCNKVSLTINLPYSDWDHIRGISASGIAERVTDPDEFARFGQLAFAKFPQIGKYVPPGEAPQLAAYRIKLGAVSLLDYTKGFGHTENVDLR